MPFSSYLTLNNIETLISGLESFEMVLFESLGTVSCLHFIATMAVSLAVSKIFSVKEWRDLEMWIRDRSRSLKIAPFDGPYMIWYWSAIINIDLSCIIFEIKRDLGRKSRYFFVLPAFDAALGSPRLNIAILCGMEKLKKFEDMFRQNAGV